MTDARGSRQSTTVESLTLRTLFDQVEGRDAERTIVLPRFQRAVVWSASQRKDLLSSLLRGFPVGSLLLALDGRDPDGRERFSLVDGLQRTTAILELMRSPLRAISLDSIVPQDLFDALSARCQELVPTASSRIFSEAVEDWLPGISGLSRSDGFDWDDLRSHVRSVVDPDDLAHSFWESPETTQVLKRILDDVESKIRAAGDIQIAALVYRGSNDHLPHIFERLNSSGTPLTRYEIYAATWGHSSVSGEGEGVRQAVEARYASVLERGFELDFVFDESAPLNLFEYLFGLGKVLADRFTLLFPDSPNPSDESPTAFVLATVLFGLQISQMGKLEQVMKSQLGDAFDVSAFEDAVLEACEEVQQRIAPVVSLQLRSSAKTRFIAHSQNQILSQIARYMVERYDTVSWAKATERERTARAAQILKWIPHHFFFDVISENWKGAGDSRLFRVVWESVEQETGTRSGAADLRPAPLYMSPPTDIEWGMALDQWHSRQTKKSQVSRTSISNVDKLVLKLIYSGRISHLDNLNVQFEIEHVYPVSGLKTRISSAGDAGWPISAISNLALLPAKTNREKGAQTVAAFLQTLSEAAANDPESNDPLLTEEHLRAAVIGPAVETLDWTYGSRQRSEGFVKADYEEFLAGRWLYLREAILAALMRLSG